MRVGSRTSQMKEYVRGLISLERFSRAPATKQFPFCPSLQISLPGPLAALIIPHCRLPAFTPMECSCVLGRMLLALSCKSAAARLLPDIRPNNRTRGQSRLLRLNRRFPFRCYPLRSLHSNKSAHSVRSDQRSSLLQSATRLLSRTNSRSPNCDTRCTLPPTNCFRPSSVRSRATLEPLQYRSALRQK